MKAHFWNHVPPTPGESKVYIALAILAATAGTAIVIYFLHH